MRLKQLRGLPVIDPTAARKIGTVTDYQVDQRRADRWRWTSPRSTTTRMRASSPSAFAAWVRRGGHSARGASASASVDINENWLDNSTLVGLGSWVTMAIVSVTIARRPWTGQPDIDAYVLRATFWERLLSRGGRIPRPRSTRAAAS
jgi:hypothetical protein